MQEDSSSSKSSFVNNPDGELDRVDRFHRSLMDLSDLSSQLHFAAEYCETTFSRAHQKKLVLSNTKEYISKAIVTVVDHLGSVAANLECRLWDSDGISEIELRINSLKQRFVTCQQYGHDLEFANVRWREKHPRHHQRYISTCKQEMPTHSIFAEPANQPLPLNRSNGVFREVRDLIALKSVFNKKDRIDLVVGVPRAAHPCTDFGIKKRATDLTKGVDHPTVMPVFEAQSMIPKSLVLSSGSQVTRRLEPNEQKRKTVQSNDFLSFLRRSKRVS